MLCNDSGHNKHVSPFCVKLHICVKKNANSVLCCAQIPNAITLSSEEQHTPFIPTEVGGWILRKYGIAGLGLGLGAMSYGGQQSE